MCRQITCRSCGKPSWAGCGAHVEQVLGAVPRDQRCQCRTAGAARRPAPTPAPGSPGEGGGWLSRLRRR